MTRINISILPDELSDQHLCAEYRELPRMRAMAIDRLARFGGTGPRPLEFTLGTGHMAFFLPFGNWLESHWRAFVAEMVYRGFSPTLDWREYPPGMCVYTMHTTELERARPLLIERIRSRLATGKRKPVWTNRRAPAWAP